MITDATWLEERNQFLEDDRFRDAMCNEYGLSEQRIETAMRHFTSWVDSIRDYKNRDDLRKHFYYWFRKAEHKYK